VVAAALMTAARWVDVPLRPLVLVQSLSPLAGPVSLVALAAAVLPGRRTARLRLACACLVVLTSHAVIWAPWFSEETPGPGAEVTLMAVNLYRGRADAGAITRTVRAEGVDVLVLSEVTPGAVTDLREHGLERLPYGHGVVLRGVHAFPPVPGRLRQWRTSFHELTRWVHRTRGPVVLAGDFNASVDHPGMRELLAGGLRDAHEAAGAGRPPTWPHGRWVPAFVQLDHVLVRGVDVDSADETRIPGTDHDAVIVDLVVPVHTSSRS
jgi:hypothetical protein